MSAEEVDAVLDDARTIILCSNDPDGPPHPMPMWFVRDDDGAILMTTFGKSHKVANLAEDARVSLLVEDGEEYSELRGVVLHGTAEVVEDDDVVLDTMLAVAAKQGGTDRESVQALAEGIRPQAAKRVRLRVVPERVISWDHRKLDGVY